MLPLVFFKQECFTFIHQDFAVWGAGYFKTFQGFSRSALKRNAGLVVAFIMTLAVKLLLLFNPFGRTSKSGKSGRTAVNYNGFFGAGKVLGKLDVLDAVDYLKYQYERNRGSVVDSTNFVSNFG